MTVLSAVMLKGRELFIWMLWCIKSDVTHVFGKRLAGWIVRRWIVVFMEMIGYELSSVSNMSLSEMCRTVGDWSCAAVWAGFGGEGGDGCER
ncbi:conserved hypothetical protein [Ricinus communis]|uniref:Uncharacterized protein n=1 Tax=Ricinus communis TaxID=3988 RepID=B9TF63_RICCO|nr:conserved hypothetical protein [Ricinus communis]